MGHLPNCRTTLAVLRGEAVGLLPAEKWHDGSYGDFNIAVDPKFHRRGLGSALMERGLNELIELGCEIAVADYWLQNAKVQALNRKYGFRIVRAYNYHEIKAFLGRSEYANSEGEAGLSLSLRTLLVHRHISPVFS